MRTLLMMLAQYEGRTVVAVEDVCRDYFSHLSPPALLRKIGNGEIQLPLIRMEAGSQKTAKGVHVADLAAYVDERRAAAVRECQQLGGA
jgi:hypothetical protein